METHIDIVNQKRDEENSRIALQGSWFCKLFQEYNLDIHEKQEVLRRIARMPYDG